MVDDGTILGRVTAIRGDSIESTSDGRKGVDGDKVVLVRGFRIGGELAHDVAIVRGIRSVGFGGDECLSDPVMADVKYAWNAGFRDARTTLMREAESILAAMVAGADIVIVGALHINNPTHIALIPDTEST